MLFQLIAVYKTIHLLIFLQNNQVLKLLFKIRDIEQYQYNVI